MNKNKENIEAVEEQARELLAYNQQAYKQVFNDENVFVKTVLEDLSDFCRAYQTTFHADQRLHAVLEGRREVWLRIMERLTLNTYELQNKILRKWGINDNGSNDKSSANNSSNLGGKRTSGTAEQLKPEPDTSGLGLDDRA